MCLDDDDHERRDHRERRGRYVRHRLGRFKGDLGVCRDPRCSQVPDGQPHDEDRDDRAEPPTTTTTLGR
jgi:hypothetical protein